MSAEENILVVPRPVFDRLGAFEGLAFEPEPYIQAFLDPANNLFLPRGAAENDPTHKQLIPYLVLHHGDRVLCYTRGKAGGEARLHAKMSIGIGGHINDGDTHAEHFDQAAYFRAVERELHEELVIPYLVLHHGDRVLCYTRGKAGGEARLHAKMSIGIGGHINDGDTHAEHFDQAAYFRAVERELHEELVIPGGYRQRIAALLNDDSNDVGRVHLGVVHLIEVDSTEIQPREEAIRDLRFLTAGELAPLRDRLESWSQICFDGLGQLLRRP